MQSGVLRVGLLHLLERRVNVVALYPPTSHAKPTMCRRNVEKR